MESFRKYAFMAMALVMSGETVYMDNEPKHSGIPDVRLSDEDKQRAKRNYENQFHTYNVNGEIIRARSKKDAKIIYQRKHKKNHRPCKR